MKKTIIALVLTLSMFTLAPAQLVFAACTSTPSSSKEQILNGTGAAGGECDPSGVTNILSTAIQILSLVIGIAAVIMIVIAGMKYITSGGESSKVASAKNTLIYALIGIAVAALAQFMVHYVIAQGASSTSPTCKTGETPKHDHCAIR